MCSSLQYPDEMPLYAIYKSMRLPGKSATQRHIRMNYKQEVEKMKGKYGASLINQSSQRIFSMSSAISSTSSFARASAHTLLERTGTGIGCGNCCSRSHMPMVLSRILAMAMGQPRTRAKKGTTLLCKLAFVHGKDGEMCVGMWE